MTDHHYIDPDRLEQWLEQHDGLWVMLFLMLLFALFGFAVYDMFARGDAFLLNGTIPFLQTEL